MKEETYFKVRQMRTLVIKFLEVAGAIEESEWMEVIKGIQKDRERLRRMSKSIELGNVFVMLFFMNEILEGLAFPHKTPK